MTNASHYCHAAYIFADQPECKLLSETAIDQMKEAAKALGYELIERIPGIPTETAAHIISACEATETVPNGARDA